MIEGIVIMEKTAECIELVGNDDTITKEITLLVVMDPKDPAVVKYYRKDDETKVGEVPVKELIKLVPKAELLRLLLQLTEGKKRSE